MNMDNVIIISLILGAVSGFVFGYYTGMEKGYIEGASDVQRVNR